MVNIEPAKFEHLSIFIVRMPPCLEKKKLANAHW